MTRHAVPDHLPDSGQPSHWQPWSLRDLVSDLNQGRVSPAEAAARARARIDETDSEVQAWVDVDPGNQTGRGSEAASGPLGGVPIGVKDIIDLAGHRTRAGSPLRQDIPAAQRDAAIVTAWRRAGASPLGKTVTTEFAYFTPGPTRNPADLNRTPGGSSSGSAAAVAAGQVPLALGSQTAGSLTRPAAFCGVAGLVLGHGRFPEDGVVGLSPSLDNHGVLTATVSDLALAWSALTGAPDVGAAQTPEGAGPSVLLWNGSELGDLDPQMVTAMEDVAARLAAAGCRVDLFTEDDVVNELAVDQQQVMAFEAARVRAVEYRSRESLGPALVELLDRGAALDWTDQLAARERIGRSAARLARATDGHDLVLGPAALGPAPHGIDATGDPVLSRPWQALGSPVVTIPLPRKGSRAPLAVQAIGIGRSETALLRSAVRLEQLLSGD